MTLDGLLLPLITPFTPAGEVDHPALARLAEEALADGAAGLVVLGTTAEAATLDAAERRAVLDTCVATRAPVVVGAGTNDTRGSLAALHELAGRPEVRAALVPVPPFTRPAAAGVVAHFAALATARLPIVVYDVPARTGRELDAPTLRALAAIDGVVGVKYAVGAVGPTAIDLLADPPPAFTVFAGDDVVAPALLALGAGGAILASAHVATGRWAELVAAWRRGDVAGGRALTAPLTRLAAALFAEPNPVVIKAVLHAQGRIASPQVRLPLLPASQEALDVALAAAELVVARRPRMNALSTT